MNSTQNSVYSISTQDEIIAGMLKELHESMGELAEEMIPELAMMFLEDAPIIFTKIHQAIKDGDAFKVKELAHIIKGSCASMGITVLAEHFQAIENMGDSGNLESATVGLANAQAEYEQVRLVLDVYASELKKA